jgi:hypothetical protein
MLIKMLIFCSLTFSIQVVANNTDAIPIYCDSDCNFEVEVTNLIKAAGKKLHPSMRVEFIVNQKSILEAPVDSFLSYEQIHNITRLDTTKSNFVVNSALNCEWDPDWSCDDWEADHLWGNYAIGVRAELRKTAIQLMHTQQSAAGANSAVSWFVNVLSFAPTGAVAAYIAKFGSKKLYHLISSVVGGSLAKEISDIFSSKNVKAGDLIVISGAGDAHYIRAEDIASGLAPILSPNNGFRCTKMTVYTDSGDGPVAQQLCIITKAAP